MPMETTWIKHEYTRIFSLLYEYVPTGRKNVGRPRKRWRDQYLWKGSKPGLFIHRLAAEDDDKRRKTWAPWCL